MVYRMSYLFIIDSVLGPLHSTVAHSLDKILKLDLFDLSFSIQ